ncbi:MAG TPA: bifunctional nuclease family protein [Acidimicrobiales bacterium]
MVEVRLRAVRVDLQSNTPVLLLQESEALGRTLPIFIGAPEATAIAFALEGVDTPRPLTHDLMKDVLDVVGVTVAQVVVTELRDQTYFAELVLTAFGETYTVSSRPSDAIALAVRVKCPILADSELLDVAGYLEDPGEEEVEDESVSPDEVVEEFRNFIDSVNPDDFAS